MVNKVLFCALVLSLMFNIYQWRANQRSEQQQTPPENTVTAQSSPSPFTKERTVSPQTSDTTPQTQDSPPNLAQLNDMLNQGEYVLLNDYLAPLLQNDPYNEAYLLLEAELMLRTMPLSSALIHLYDLLDRPLSASTQDTLRAQIASRYTQAESELLRSANWDLLAQLVEPLFQRVPDNRDYILALATAYAEQQKNTLMEDVLAALPLNDPSANRIRDNAYARNADVTEVANSQPISENDSSVTTVPLERRGRQYRVSVGLLNHSSSMILDTGASTTAITQAMYKTLNARALLPFIGNFDVQTASGTINAPMVQVPVLFLGEYRFENVAALVLPQDVLPSADGLLGMNVLGQFDFSIKPEENELILKAR